MNFALETLQVLALSIYYNLEALVKLFIPSRKKSVAGETILITGAGSGIGRLMALEFASMGVTLVLWDISQDGNKETVRLVKQKGAARVHSYICDCSNKAEVYSVADQVGFMPPGQVYGLYTWPGMDVITHVLPLSYSR